MRSPAEAANGRDVIITCLPVSADVESLLDGPDGLLASMKRGATLVDCTSGDPPTSRRIATKLAERGMRFLDAPVSGGTSGARNGKLTVMVGGDAAVLEQVRPIIERFGERIVHCGDVGAGDAIKAVNNALLAMHIWGTAEGLIALEKSGVRSDIALEVINSSSGRSNSSMNLFPERVLTRDFPRTFRLALLDKDARIAAELASGGGRRIGLARTDLAAFCQGPGVAWRGGRPCRSGVRFIEKIGGAEIGQNAANASAKKQS